MTIHQKINKLLILGIPRWMVLCIDLYVTLFTFLLAYIVSNKLSFDGMDRILFFLPEVGLVSLAVFLIAKSYKGIIRHTGFRDARRVFLVDEMIAVVLIVISLAFRQYPALLSYAIPIHLIIIHFLLNTIILILIRLIYKGIYRRYVLPTRNYTRTLIYGAHKTGFLTQKALENDPESSVQVVGFIDHNTHNVGKRMDGIKVYDARKMDKEFIQHHNIDEVIISYTNLSSQTLQKIFDVLSEFSVSVKTIPPVTEWLNGDFKARQIKPIKIEDLLGRAPIDYNNPKVYQFLKGKVVLITGAAGSIGGEISRQAVRYPAQKFIFIDQAESALYELQQDCKSIGHKTSDRIFIVADICDAKRMDDLFTAYKPDIVFHAAAYKHVPLMENNPYEAIRNNISGTKTLADIALTHRVEKFIMISTDKAVNPANIMGTTKRISELYVNYLNRHSITRFSVTRFGNVLGSNGSVIPIFKKQIQAGGPLTVTHKEITRYFMTIPEASQLVLVAGSMGKGGEIFIFDIGQSIKIYDLAKRMIRLSGLHYPEDINIRITGLRPGEKLYEELFTANENSEKTQHEKIMIARFCNRYQDDFEENVNAIISMTHTNGLENDSLCTLVRLLKAVVPEYDPQNTVYSTVHI